MVHTNFSTRLTQCLHLTLEMQFKNFLENFARKNQGLSQIIMYILSSEDLCHIAFSRKRALQLISSGYAPNPCDAHSVLKLRIPFGNYMGCYQVLMFLLPPNLHQLLLTRRYKLAGMQPREKFTETYNYVSAKPFCIGCH